jgi:hypothetical protein
MGDGLTRTANPSRLEYTCVSGLRKVRLGWLRRFDCGSENDLCRPRIRRAYCLSSFEAWVCWIRRH